ncbi:MAG: glycosyltransferase family 4 protein [Rhodospirillales bacterium]|jgi:glycosyltransferase involved in cell wall biosynthesis
MPSLKNIAAQSARHFLAGSYSWGRRLGLYDPGPEPIRYIAEKADWVIRQDALSYAQALNAVHPGLVAVTDRPELATGRIAHFGSQFIWQAWAKALDQDTRCLITYFHGRPEDGPDMALHVDFFMRNLHRLQKIVTAAGRVERRLLDWGVPRRKLALVPLGIDLQLFRPPGEDKRREARQTFGVPPDRLCIGSFQKDGEGWGEGLSPKLIKGPDIFVEAVEKLSKDFPVFVLLTGPARGYVKKRLEKAGIPYAHHVLPRADMVSEAFHALDLYIVASREEGGPKAVLESLASGVSLVSTRVGMAEDVVRHEINGLLVDAPDALQLADQAGRLLADPALAGRLRAQGLQDIQDYSWDRVAALLYERAYRSLLER